MDETLRIILELAGALLISAVGFVLGQRAERQRQSLTIKASMLDPIGAWIGGVERFVGIIGDTLTSMSAGSETPLMYSMEERRVSAQLMAERTNEVLGILASRALVTSKTRADANALAELIRKLDGRVKYDLLPTNGEILDRAGNQGLGPQFVARVAALKLGIDTDLQEAHRLIARIKANLV
jgi:hypothetical protein